MASCLSVLAVIGIVVVVVVGYMLGLAEKIPHLFTTNPHLGSELPALADYPRLMGGWWLIVGVAGWLLLMMHSLRKHQHYRETTALCISIAILFVLSQGPRFFIDIPPVRALFYLCIPLSIAGAYFITSVASYINTLPLTPGRILLHGTLTICLAGGFTASLATSYAAAPLAARTNSTLTPGIQYALGRISSVPAGAIITDDYGKRAASWFLLSGR
ncbi:MAG: hypothetical protein HYZ63_00505, partial [Candidatus Andersenbacteria bacterium]|nr:hypothetical protein [Candidatus Andersenbacteria bacterium]